MNTLLKKLSLWIYDFPVNHPYLSLLLKILVCVVLLVLLIMNRGDAVSAAIGTIIGVVAGLISLYVIRLIHRTIEDDIKVRHDDAMLAGIYDVKKYWKQLDSSQPKTGFFYDASYCHSAGNNIIIEDDPNKHFEIDSFIKSHSLELLKAHDNSRINNSVTVRLDDFKIDDPEKEVRIRTSRSTYFNHLVTNRAVDYRLGSHTSLRTIYEYGEELASLPKSAFSNHIGIIALLFLEDDNYLLIPRRAANVSISKGKIASSITRCLTLKDYSKEMTFEELASDYIKKYVEKDLFLDGNEICGIEFLGFGRDVYEGGKPHFFYTIRANVTAADYAKKLREERKNKNMGKNKNIYIASFPSLSVKGEALSFDTYQKNGKHKKVCLTPEKTFLANIWHYSKMPNFPYKEIIT